MRSRRPRDRTPAASRFELGHRERHPVTQAEPAGRHEADPVADREVLPLLPNLVCVVDAEPSEVLEPVIAVEAAAVLADLDEPAPHLVGRRFDRHGAGGDISRIGDQFVAGQRGRAFAFRRTPVAKSPGFDERGSADGSGAKDHDPHVRSLAPVA